MLFDKTNSRQRQSDCCLGNFFLLLLWECKECLKVVTEVLERLRMRLVKVKKTKTSIKTSITWFRLIKFDFAIYQSWLFYRKAKRFSCETWQHCTALADENRYFIWCWRAKRESFVSWLRFEGRKTAKGSNKLWNRTASSLFFPLLCSKSLRGLMHHRHRRFIMVQLRQIPFKTFSPSQTRRNRNWLRNDEKFKAGWRGIKLGKKFYRWDALHPRPKGSLRLDGNLWFRRE